MLLVQRCGGNDRPLASILFQNKNGVTLGFFSFWSGVGYAFFSQNQRALEWSGSRILSLGWHGSFVGKKMEKSMEGH